MDKYSIPIAYEITHLNIYNLLSHKNLFRYMAKLFAIFDVILLYSIYKPLKKGG